MQASITTASMFLLVIKGLLPGCFCHLEIPQNKFIPPVTVTEIHQIMPDLPEADAQNHYIRLIVENATSVEEGLTWELNLIKTDNHSLLFHSTDATKNNGTFTVTFDTPLPDIIAMILMAKNSSDKIMAVWSAAFTLRDLKARVTVVGDKENDMGFLMVTTGDTLTEVIVDGTKTCSSSNRPCYYRLNELTTNYTSIERCIDLITKQGNLKHCDETYSSFKALEDDPYFILLNNNALYVNYNNFTPAVEVLLVDSISGDQIENPEGTNCTVREDETSGCSLNVVIPNGKTNLNIITVLIDDNDFVLGSKTYPFEIFDVSWIHLADDAIMTTWTSGEMMNFTVSMVSKSVSQDPLYQYQRRCGGTVPGSDLACEAFFVHHTAGVDVDTIIVQQNKDQNGMAISKAPTEVIPATRVARITITPDTAQDIIKLEVNTTNEIPTSGKLIEVINDATTSSATMVSNYECDVTISEILDGYMIQCTLANVDFEGEKNLILIGYNDTSDILEVGLVYATLKVIDVKLDRVGKSSINASALWATVVSEDVVFEDVNCKQGSTCFILDFPSSTSSVPVCTQINNTFDSTELDQCVDTIPSDTEAMFITKFQLINRSLVSVTAPYAIETSKVSVVLYDKEQNSWLSECTSLTISGRNTCTSSPSPPLPPEQIAVLRALIVSESENGDIIASTAVEVEDLIFNFTKLYPDTLTVVWTANNPEGYTSTLQEISPPKSKFIKAITAEVPSDIVCQENTCSAFYYGLDVTSNYKLSVHRIGESTSETIQFIDAGEVTDVGDGKRELLITKVTKINGGTTQVDFSSDLVTVYTMETLVVMDNIEQVIQFTSEASIENKNQIRFNHNIPIFDGSKDVLFVFQYFDINQKLLSKGRAYLLLADLDVKLAWLSPGTGNPRSLRVDVGSQNEVIIGTERCLKMNSPCYFIDDNSLPSIVERCETILNSADDKEVEQCDSEITPYTELKNVKVSLSGSNIKVIAPLNDPESTFEVMIYDPANSSSIFSEGNATCETVANGSTWDCTQKLRTPSDQRPLKVFVVELGPEGNVLKSAVNDIIFPPTGVESWVIAVSVLASVLGAGIIVYIIVVIVKKNKSKKAVKKEILSLSGVNKEPQRGNRKRSVSLEDLEDPYFQGQDRNRNPPPVPRKPSRQDSRYLGGPVPGQYQSPYGQGQSNSGYVRGDRFGDAPIAIPRLQTRVQPDPGRSTPPGYY